MRQTKAGGGGGGWGGGVRQTSFRNDKNFMLPELKLKKQHIIAA